MARVTKFTAEQIITKLREAEVLLAQGQKVPDACRVLGVSDKTFLPLEEVVVVWG